MSKILIIEDEKEIADLEKDYLEMNDLEVEICDRGDTGLEAALNNDYNLIILDVMLPGVDGFKAHLAQYQRLVGAGTRKQENSTIEVRGIRIDKSARRVFIDGEEKIFTTKEFDLLTFLAENPNKVYTKDDLFRTIWGMESMGDIATVTVHIKKIREKLGDVSGDSKYIETIWGVGYRFKS